MASSTSTINEIMNKLATSMETVKAKSGSNSPSNSPSNSQSKNQISPRQTNKKQENETMDIKSLYIPVVYTVISEQKIKDLFEEQEIAVIASVNLVSKTIQTNVKVNMAFIHVAYWKSGEKSETFQREIRSQPKGAKFVYNDPYYWMVLENKSASQPVKMAMEGILPIPSSEAKCINDAILVKPIIFQQSERTQSRAHDQPNVEIYDTEIPEALTTAIKYCEDAKKVLEEKLKEIEEKMQNLIKTREQIIEEKQKDDEKTKQILITDKAIENISDEDEELLLRHGIVIKRELK